MQENASVLMLLTKDKYILAYLCRRQKDKVLVIMNLSTQTADFELDHPAITGYYEDLFTREKVEMKRRQNYSFKPGDYKLFYYTNVD
jgi:hypothetical protein